MNNGSRGYSTRTLSASSRPFTSAPRSDPNPAVKGAFFNKMLSCNNPKCTFSHSPEAMRAAAQDAYRRWVAQQGQAQSAPHSDTRDGSGHTMPPPKKPPESWPPPYLSMHAIEATLLHAIRFAIPHDKIAKSVFKPGYINLITGTRLPFQALLDSGALHGSYIGKSFSEHNRSLLNGVIRTSDGCVTLADNITKIPISENVVCNVTMKDNDGVTYSFAEELSVIDSNKEVIIGLPTIIQHILPLFVSALCEA